METLPIHLPSILDVDLLDNIIVKKIPIFLRDDAPSG